MFKQIYALVKRDALDLFWLISIFFIIFCAAHFLPKFYLADAPAWFKGTYTWFFRILGCAFLGVPVVLALRSKASKAIAFVFLIIAIQLMPYLRIDFIARTLSARAGAFLGSSLGLFGAEFVYAFYFLPVFVFWLWFLKKEGNKQKFLNGVWKSLVFLLILAIFDTCGTLLHYQLLLAIQKTGNSFLISLSSGPLFGVMRSVITFVGTVVAIYFLTGWAQYEKNRSQEILLSAEERF